MQKSIPSTASLLAPIKLFTWLLARFGYVANGRHNLFRFINLELNFSSMADWAAVTKSKLQSALITRLLLTLPMNLPHRVLDERKETQENEEILVFFY
jgi:hypothetical protein